MMTKKLGPFPAYVWVGGAALIVLVVLLRKKTPARLYVTSPASDSPIAQDSLVQVPVVRAPAVMDHYTTQTPVPTVRRPILRSA